VPGSRWPLVVFTVLTQMAAGLTVALLALDLLAVGTATAVMQPLVAGSLVAALVMLATGVVAALGHLGRPRDAWRALANLGSSWLSREMLFGLVFGLALVAAAWVWRLPDPTAPRRLMLAVAALAGLAFTVAMARLYMLRAVPSWAAWTTPVGFLATALVLGVGAAAASLVLAPVSVGGWTPDGRLGLLPALGWVAAALVAVQAAVSAGSSLRLVRLGLAACGVAALLVGGYVATAGTAAGGPASVVTIAGSVLIVAAEVLGRVMFYASYRRLGL